MDFEREIKDSLRNAADGAADVGRPDRTVLSHAALAAVMRRRRVQTGVVMLVVAGMAGGAAVVADRDPVGSSSHPQPVPSVDPVPIPIIPEPKSAMYAHDILYTTTEWDGSSPDSAAYTERVWLWDATTGQSRLLVDGLGTETGRQPETFWASFMLDEQTALLRVSDGPDTTRLDLLDLESGKRKPTRVELGDQVGCDLHPDGSMLACVTSGEMVDVSLVDLSTGTIDRIRRLGRAFRAGGSPEYETSATWSPDGSTLLVVETQLGHFGSRKPAVFVLDREGRDLLEPLDGNHARWLSDNTFLMKDRSDDATGWMTVDPATGQRQEVAMASDGFDPQVSPDGRFVAYVAGPTDHSYLPENKLRVFDLVAGTDETYGHHVHPVWLAPDVLLATEIVEARGRCDGYDGLCYAGPRKIRLGKPQTGIGLPRGSWVLGVRYAATPAGTEHDSAPIVDLLPPEGSLYLWCPDRTSRGSVNVNAFQGPTAQDALESWLAARAPSLSVDDFDAVPGPRDHKNRVLGYTFDYRINGSIVLTVDADFPWNGAWSIITWTACRPQVDHLLPRRADASS